MHIPGMKKAYTYLGSKYSVLPWLLPRLPHTKGFIDACGGSGCVLINKDPCSLEVYNDKNQRLVNFFQVLRGPQRQALIEQLLLTPHSRWEYEHAWDESGDSDVERARKFFVRVQQSFLATGSQKQLKGWLSSIRESRGSVAQATHKWLSSVEGLVELVERLSMVQLECRDVHWVVDKYDDRENLIYIDPPYDPQHRSGVNSYEYDFTEEDHLQLRDRVENCAGLVAISGYDSDFMKLLYKGWYFHQGPQRRNNYSDRDVKECLWTNYNLSELKNGRLF